MEPELETVDDERSMDALYSHDRLIDESFEALVRLVDTYDGFNHLVQAAPHLTPAEYVEAAKGVYGIALHGTGISLESMDLSVEATDRSMMEIARAIGRAISEFFKRVFVWLSEIDVVVTITKRRAFMAHKAAIAARGRVIRDPFVDLNRLHRYLRCGHVYLQDSIRMEHELKHLLSVSQTVFGDLSMGVLNALDRVPTVMNHPDKKEACVQVVESIPFATLASKLNMRPVDRSRFNRDGVQTSGALMGGNSVFLFQSPLREKGTVGLRFHGFQYAPTLKEQFPHTASRRFDTMGPLDVVKLPEILIDLLTAVSRVTNSTTIGKIKRAKSVAENFSMRVAQDGTLSTVDRDYIRKTVNALMYWTTNVTRPMGNDVISVCKAVLHYCHSSLKAQG